MFTCGKSRAQMSLKSWELNADERCYLQYRSSLRSPSRRYENEFFRSAERNTRAHREDTRAAFAQDGTGNSAITGTHHHDVSGKRSHQVVCKRGRVGANAWCSRSTIRMGSIESGAR